MIPMHHDPAWPLIAIIGDTAVSALMNSKAYRKSIENGSPWIVHPQTGRVLPWPKSPRTYALSAEPGCYRIQLPAGSSTLPYGRELPLAVNPDTRFPLNDLPAPNTVDSSEDIFIQLAAIIADRRRSLPEGSYTTHLFTAGLEKIRKKVGEEAVELILAQDGKDVIYESADLIYHIQVLLEALQLDWCDVGAELRRRHTE